MKIFECLQGSDEWRDIRLGIPTASQFHRILTPSKGELAKGRWSYAFELAAERLLGDTKPPIDGLHWVMRGTLLEPKAVEHYEFVHDRKTVKVGFISTDDGRWGCSPDRLLVDEPGTLELKCPSAPKHLEYFYDGPGADYRCQIQGVMLITGFQFGDFMSFHETLPRAYYRFARDDAFCAKLEAALNQFCGEVDDICARIKEAGYVPTPGPVKGPVDQWAEMLKADPDLWAIA